MSVIDRVLRRETEEVVAHCPIDDWDFAPQYTDGACPICGWRPEGMEFTTPLAARIDWFWPAMGFLAMVSLAMAITVIVVYVRG